MPLINIDKLEIKFEVKKIMTKTFGNDAFVLVRDLTAAERRELVRETEMIKNPDDSFSFRFDISKLVYASTIESFAVKNADGSDFDETTEGPFYIEDVNLAVRMFKSTKQVENLPSRFDSDLAVIANHALILAGLKDEDKNADRIEETKKN